jgi:hypothetical protein
MTTFRGINCSFHADMSTSYWGSFTSLPQSCEHGTHCVHISSVVGLSLLTLGIFVGCGASSPGNQVQSLGTGRISTGCPQREPLPRSPCPMRLKKVGTSCGTPTMSSADSCLKLNSPKNPSQIESWYVMGLDQYAQAHVGNTWL